jgi:hypothetical protein
MARFPESWKVRGRGSPELLLKDGSRRAHLSRNLVHHAGLAPQQRAKSGPSNVTPLPLLGNVRAIDSWAI